MARVYLETSFVSACVTDRLDGKSLYRRDSSLDWWNLQRHMHDLFVSGEVLSEISNPKFKRSEEARVLIDGIVMVPVDDETVGVAEVLVRERVMPSPVGGDSLHVACALVHRLDYILSWNVRHLANPNKLRHLEVIARRLGLIPPAIVTPESLWEKLS